MIVIASDRQFIPKAAGKKEVDERVERHPHPTRAVLSGPFPSGTSTRSI
jgi:hypothetical protein